MGGNKGSILLMTLFIFGMFLIMMIAAISYVSRQFKQVANQKEIEQGFQVAESGVDYTLFLLRSSVKTISDLLASEPITQTVNSPLGKGNVGSFTLTFAPVADAPSVDALLVVAEGRPVNLDVCSGISARIELTSKGQFVITQWRHLPKCGVEAVAKEPTPPPPPPACPPPPPPSGVAAGPRNPVTTVDDPSFGDITWKDPTNVAVSDNKYATAFAQANLSTHYLKATNFGLSVPTNATVTGVLVEIEVRKNGPDGGSFRDATVRMVRANGTVGNANRGKDAQLDTADSYCSYGHSHDMWGERLTPADVNSSNFGVVAAYVSPANTSLVSIDHMRMTVYYTQ